MEKSIADFHTSFYSPEIQKLYFHLPRILIIGTNTCVNIHRESFKHCRENQDVLCCCDYDERVVASFHTKYNLNTMAAIDLCLLKKFHCNTLVQQHRKKNHQQHKHSHIMMCFTTLCLITENKMPTQIFHTANASLDC